MKQIGVRLAIAGRRPPWDPRRDRRSLEGPLRRRRTYPRGALIPHRIARSCAPARPKRGSNGDARGPNIMRPLLVLALASHDPTPAIFGAPGRIRTSDHRLRRPPLYPAELRAQGPFAHRLHAGTKGSGWWDSNPRQQAPKACALPGCATPRCDSDRTRSRVET